MTFDVAFAERSFERIGMSWGRRRILPHGLADAVRDFLATRVRKADIENGFVVVTGHAHGFVDLLQHILTDQRAVAQHPHGRPISIKQSTMLAHLRQFRFGQVHQTIDFVFASLEILDAECVNGDHAHTALVAYFEDARQSLKSQMMALDRLEFVCACIAAVAVHDKGDVLGDRTAFEGPDQAVSKLLQTKFDRREREEPVAHMCAMY